MQLYTKHNSSQIGFSLVQSVYLIVSRMLGTGVKTFTGARTGIAWSTRLQTERERQREKKIIQLQCLSIFFPKLNIRRRDTGSFRQSTHKPPGAVCVAGLAVNQNREHPLGCKSSKLLVELATVPMLQTSTNTDERYELCYSWGVSTGSISG